MSESEGEHLTARLRKHRLLRLPRIPAFQVHNHEICTSRLKCCVCHQICTSRFTLPLSLCFKVHKALRLPRNLHFEVHIAQPCQGVLPQKRCQRQRQDIKTKRRPPLSENDPHVQKSRFIAPVTVTKLERIEDHHHVQSAAPATESTFRSITAPIPCTCRENSALDHQSTTLQEMMQLSPVYSETDVSEDEVQQECAGGKGLPSTVV